MSRSEEDHAARATAKQSQTTEPTSSRHPWHCCPHSPQQMAVPVTLPGSKRTPNFPCFAVTHSQFEVQGTCPQLAKSPSHFYITAAWKVGKLSISDCQLSETSHNIGKEFRYWKQKQKQKRKPDSPACFFSCIGKPI